MRFHSSVFVFDSERTSGIRRKLFIRSRCPDGLHSAHGNAAAEQGSVFALEQHLIYDRALLAGDFIEIRPKLVEVTNKKLHILMVMYKLCQDYQAAICAHLFLHGDLSTRRSAPWPLLIAERLREFVNGLLDTKLSLRLNRAIKVQV